MLSWHCILRPKVRPSDSVREEDEHDHDRSAERMTPGTSPGQSSGGGNIACESNQLIMGRYSMHDEGSQRWVCRATAMPGWRCCTSSIHFHFSATRSFAHHLTLPCLDCILISLASPSSTSGPSCLPVGRFLSSTRPELGSDPPVVPRSTDYFLLSFALLHLLLLHLLHLHQPTSAARINTHYIASSAASSFTTSVPYILDPARAHSPSALRSSSHWSHRVHMRTTPPRPSSHHPRPRLDRSPGATTPPPASSPAVQADDHRRVPPHPSA